MSGAKGMLAGTLLANRGSHSITLEAITCKRCGYDAATDSATPKEHKRRCREGCRIGYPEYTANPGCSKRDCREGCRIGYPEYTANPSCSKRDWHHSYQWCDQCKGVA